MDIRQCFLRHPEQRHAGFERQCVRFDLSVNCQLNNKPRPGAAIWCAGARVLAIQDDFGTLRGSS
jgi:hypothetical protein